MNMNTPIPSHNLSIYVANRPGALARIAQTFSRRGFNIESLWCPRAPPATSRA